MISKKKRTERKKHIVPVVILALYVLLIVFNSKVNIVYGKDEGYSVVTNSTFSQNVDDMSIEMNNGTIIIIMTSKAADDENDIRYRTIGFGISLYEQTRMVTVTKNGIVYHGPDVTANVDVLYKDEIHKKDLGTDGNGNVKTQFTFSAEEVARKLGPHLDLETISNDTMLYFNAIFQSYQGSSIRKNNITSWKEMMNAESWSQGSLEGFKKYYNIPVKFSPGLQPITLYYDVENNPLFVKELAPKYINQFPSWKDEVSLEYINENNDKYKLKGFYVKGKPGAKFNEYRDEMYEEDDDTILNNIKNACDERYNPNCDKLRVPYGGLDVYFIYKENKEDDSNIKYKNTLYYEYKGRKEKVAELLEKKAGETVTWKTECTADVNSPEDIFGESGDYELLGYRVDAKIDNRNISTFSKVSDSSLTDEKIISGSAKVATGGLNIFLVYGDVGDYLPKPTPTPAPTPVPTIPPLDIPENEPPVSNPMGNLSAEGVIKADIRGEERFDVLKGIPTTESLYSQVIGTEYSIGYRFEKRVVVKKYPVTVSKKYYLGWTDAKDKKKVMEDSVEIVQTVTVKRACAYWEIDYFDCFTIDRAVIHNYALPGGSCTVQPYGSFYSTPLINLNHWESEDDHITPPPQTAPGYVIELPSETLPMGDGVMPSVPTEDFTYEAEMRTDQIRVRNDHLSFNGTIILSSGYTVKETSPANNLGLINRRAGMSHENAMYVPDQIIEATLLNDEYRTTGTLYYKNHPFAVKPSQGSMGIQINGLNPVIVHTPVICDASITTENEVTGIKSNDPYVQTLKLDKDCVQLVLDPDSNLSDFTVDIDNYGTHLRIPGYNTRDFAWGIRNSTVSYIAEKNGFYRNEVRFPFDVFYRHPSGADELIPKKSWMRFGHNTPTYYLPMWVNEGIYTVEFRTIAVNGQSEDRQLDMTQPYANYVRNNYVATDTVRVQVSGRIYGLTLYDVRDYPTWETVFRTEKGSAALKINEGYPSGVSKEKYDDRYSYDYTVGTKDQYGNPTDRLARFTLPLVKGSHPKYSNVGILKTGYSVKFKITTTGNAFSTADTVTIKPTFYYVDSEGKNRREVDVYYWEFFNNKSNRMVKVGSALDQTNIKNYYCGNKYLGIPEEQLQMMADIYRTKLYDYKWKKADLFTYSRILMHYPLMTYVNTDYLLNLKAGSQYEKIREAGINDVDIVNRMQTFYAEYYLTSDIRVVEKGFDVYGYAAKYGVSKNESFWLTGGYLIVNFDIYTTDPEGNINLSYLNLENAADGYCSMWEMEGGTSEKLSYNGMREKSTVFKFIPGDIYIYHTDKSIKDDYETYIIK